MPLIAAHRRRSMGAGLPGFGPSATPVGTSGSPGWSSAPSSSGTPSSWVGKPPATPTTLVQRVASVIGGAATSTWVGHPPSATPPASTTWPPAPPGAPAWTSVLTPSTSAQAAVPPGYDPTLAPPVATVAAPAISPYLLIGGGLAAVLGIGLLMRRSS